MPSYKRVINFIFLIIFISACSTTFQQPVKNDSVKTGKTYSIYKSYDNENRYIMFALEHLKQGNQEASRELFRRLFENTLKEEYLLEYSKLSFVLKRHDDVISKIETYKKNIVQKETEIKRVYILSLIQKKEYLKAENELNELLKKEKIDKNYELLGNIYIQKGDYKKAKDLYKQLYEKNSDSNSLLNLSNVMYLYLDEKKEAINLLESHININGCEGILCSKLLSFYQEEKNIDGIVSILKKTYYNFEKENNQFSKDRVYKLLMYYLEKKDINEAITFLEESGANNERLLTLYRNVGKYDDAYDLANKLYKGTSNIDYLAQIAIIEFERAENKKDVLAGVIKKFEDVLTVLDNHVYQNYLGYILIDYDIDVKKGISYVKEALKKAPHNLAYIDSLAWGQYKLDDCKNAYINMKKVVDGAGLDDLEIKTHWEKIKECNK